MDSWTRILSSPSNSLDIENLKLIYENPDQLQTYCDESVEKRMNMVKYLITQNKTEALSKYLTPLPSSYAEEILSLSLQMVLDDNSYLNTLEMVIKAYEIHISLRNSDSIWFYKDIIRSYKSSNPQLIDLLKHYDIHI